MSELKTWHDAAETEKASEYIHPSGFDADKYEKSGKKEAKRIVSLLPKDTQSIFEYGCGNGRVLRHLREFKTVGVDIVPKFVEDCKAQGIDAYVLPDKPTELFDAAYSITVFIHIDKEQGYKAMQIIHSVLRQGATALIQLPIYDVERDPNSWIDVGVWSLERFERVCNEIGFEIVEVKTNNGEFSYLDIGKNHNEYHILRKK